MAYRTYITEVLVCGSTANHTSDRSYLLFAREAGMLYAVAKSVREERSKQRYALQEFSYVRATLIQGRSGWRMAGVEPIKNLYAEAQTREARTVLRNIVVLLRRVMHGETPHPHLFDVIVGTLSVSGIASSKDLELILSLRTLSVLGYVAQTPRMAKMLEDKPADILRKNLENEDRDIAKSAIERALRESHL